jgi:anaerobic selenocysteine-containing dehydrogenase
MKRRKFLQLTGLSTAGGLLAGCRQGNEKLIPYLVPPEDGSIPGRALWYASVCRECPAGCGIIVRVSEGRARKIEGNPRHPVNRGRLCARGQAALQRLYHPDRVRTPLRRSGPRGSGQFTAISWDEALSTLAGNLRQLREKDRTDALALITSPQSGTLARLTATFLSTFGSPRHLAYDPLSPDWLRQASAEVYGQSVLPLYDLEQAQYVLSFGAEFLESHLSPVHYGNAFGRMRQGRATVRGKLTYAGPRLSLTAANADRWLPLFPGSEGVLALGLARELLASGRVSPRTGIDLRALEARLEPYTRERVTRQTGLSAAMLAGTISDLLKLRPALVLPGDAVASQSNGAEAVQAISLLNRLLGNLNQPGGVFLPAPAAEYRGSTAKELLELIAAMGNGEVEVALVHDCNPLHSVPPAAGLDAALAKVPLVISCSTLLDDTARQADLILPMPTALESWEELTPPTGTLAPALGLQQPVVPLLHDTRAFPDLLLALAKQLGEAVATAHPYPSYKEAVRETVRQSLKLPAGRDFEMAWMEHLQEGGIFPPGPDVAAPSPTSSVPPDVPEARFAGDPYFFPFHLQLYPSTAFHSGHGAALPWLQELPDPLTTVVWDSWVELNPQAAARLGVGHGDLVEVTSPAGSLRLPAVVFPGLHPEVVAIPLGQGHQGDGRYADGRGVNPLALLAPLKNGSPLPPWGATRVGIKKLTARGELVTAGNPQGSYRSELLGF